MQYNPTLGILGNIRQLFTERNQTNNHIFNNKAEADNRFSEDEDGTLDIASAISDEADATTEIAEMLSEIMDAVAELAEVITE